MKKPKTFHSKLETLRYETIPITFHLNFVGEKLYTILSVSVLSVSVSADMKIIISVFYRYRPIKKKAYRSYTVRNDATTIKNPIGAPKVLDKLFEGFWAKSCEIFWKPFFVQFARVLQWVQADQKITRAKRTTIFAAPFLF